MLAQEHRAALPQELLRLRALTLPTRIAFLQHIARAGPATAAECAPFVNGSPSACSRHLRALDKSGCVEALVPMVGNVLGSIL